MMTKPGLHVSIDWWRQDISQNICRKVPDDVVLHIWQFKIWLQFHFKSFVRSYVCSMNDFEVNKRWARFLDFKLRLDHTLSQSTDKLRSDNSLFQIVLIERGFVIQSRILLYIKENRWPTSRWCNPVPHRMRGNGSRPRNAIRFESRT